MSARERIYYHIRANGLKAYSGEELRRIGAISDWARVIRQLKQDDIIEYEYDTSSSSYVITKIGEYSRQTRRSGLTSKDLYRIRNRDGHRCQSCGQGVNDGVRLHVDHKIPLDWGGTNNDDNLWTLCSSCNQAKKSFFKDDFDSEVMKLVYAESSGYQKLRVLFENSPNVKFSPSILQGIAGIRDWTRTIRNIRERYNLNITWFASDEEHPSGYYSNVV
ncbi:HNH endonuclease [Flagellimonas meishanensis]|uniref:HNH endonuclease n=1 Tax=Flagellimonas meishanensis TaxID=2873264 RepID=UPI001CA66B86|nr:HNH endonuclease signature motif containing protein [[Muricauda] meishanensis]